MTLPDSPRAVVTGAGSGFGRAVSLELARRKARLVLSDVDVAAAEETRRLAELGGARDAHVLSCDVRKSEEVEELARAADAEFGGTDLVVNNAGVSASGPVGEVTLEDWRWTVDVDLWGVIYGCHAFVPRMRKQRSGHILNVASAAGFAAAPNMGPYNVAKAGVMALSETLAAELASSGVGVTVLCPTFFHTNILASGHFTSERLNAGAQKIMARTRWTADQVAERALSAVDKRELYCMPMADGRWLWRVKRAVPAVYVKLLQRLEKHFVDA